MDVTAGGLFGRYRLEARLGGGSFGSVWRAFDTETGQVVALKILAGSYSESEGAQLRTDVEVLAATAAAGSTHVVRVLGGGLDPAAHVVMEYLEGTDLAASLAARGKLPQAEVIGIGEAVADALAALTRVGIIHRDVKPANIMMGPDGGVKLTDFGIAKIVGFDTATSTGQLPLTMAYAAPEVWDGKASSASDLYALGVVLYQCLTGKLPFTGSYSEVYKGHISGTPDFDLLPADTTAALRSFIESCLAKDVAYRPSDPEAALAQLHRAKGELEARQGAAGGHPPIAFGPWQIVAPHPTRAWAWGARHEKTGDRAIVEVCFGPNASLGETLHRAVDANPVLVPLGAERLVGTNRLILRPDEAWPVPPPSGPFAFWVAREELPVPPPATLGQPELRHVVESVLLLRNTANAAGVRLDLGPTALVALPDGSVHVRRPGLPSDSNLGADAAALDSIRRLPLDLALTATVARAPSLQALGRVLGVADGPIDVPSAEAATLPPTVVIKPSDEEAGEPVVEPAPAQPLPAEGGDRRRRRRVAVAIGLGAIVVALVAATAFGAFFAGGAHPSPTGSGQMAAAASIASLSSSLAGDASASEDTSAGPGGSASPGPGGSASSARPSTGTVQATPTSHGTGAAPAPIGPAATLTPSPTPTLAPVITPAPDPNPDLVVSTDPTQSTDGVSHGSGQPYPMPSGALFHNVTIQSGAYVTASGTTLSFSATGTVTVAGVITMDGHGYAGGNGNGIQGNSASGNGTQSSSANGGGGGGGNDVGGGGGGGYGTAGSPGRVPAGSGWQDQGGGTYGDSSLSTLYPGSGGGSSANNMWGGFVPAAGGAGGGIIKITAASITVSGSIEANGRNGASSPTNGNNPPKYYRAGGGGSGGSILLTAASFSGASNVVARGGQGGYGLENYGGYDQDVSGGAGGDGRIRFAH